MTWLTWRQHRIEALIAALALVVLGIIFVRDGLAIYAAYSSMGMAACVARGPACDNTARYAFQAQTNGASSYIAFTLLSWLPLLVGVFVGAPLVAREREHRTYYLVWMQSMTRRRWLAVKLGMVAGATLLAFAILSALTTWWAAPLNAVLGPWMIYDIQGIVPIGYALFALMLGVAAGALLRRTIPAMAATCIIFLLFFALMHFAYPYLVPPKSAIYPVSITSQNGAWGGPTDLSLYAGYADQQGHETGELSQYCGFHATIADASYGPLANQCIREHNLQWKLVYQSAANFWPLQAVQTAILLILAAILTFLSFWLLRKRQN